MEYRQIDMESYARKAHFAYFSNMAYPYMGTTVQLDITDFYHMCKEKARPIFLSLLYEISHAANAVPEFRQRIKDGGIIEYEWCPSSHTLALANGTYCYCNLDARMPREEFLHHAKQAQEKAMCEPSIEDGADADSLLFISCLPWLHFCSLTQPVPYPADSNPRITWGKFAEENGRVLLPLAVLAHHALIDGRQLAAFYENCKARMEQAVKER